ncbi:MAG: riboflavin kinase, partial [Omnitrophica WOR_2 bacterium]
ALPKPGVYVCLANVNGVFWKAVTNVGVRPTFEVAPVLPRVEAHLLDFDGNLYGQRIHLDFKARIRDEQKFPDIQALISQIHQDIARTRKILSV